MITIQSKGSFENTERFLNKMAKGEIFKVLDSYGVMGVDALANATPKDSGETASRWDYKVEYSNGKYSIVWTNDKVIDGTPLVILLQFGHGTGTGGYVEGRDFINPAVRPIFDKISTDVWRAVTTA